MRGRPFQKGHTPWSKGTKGIVKKTSGSFKKGHEQLNTGRTRFKKGENIGEEHPQWKGGIVKTSNGYIWELCPNHPSADKRGYVLQRRLIVERFIGRYLTKEEVVHHIDENRENNDIDNLMIFKNQREHMKFHIKVKKFGFNNQIRRQIEERWNEFPGSKSK